MYAQQGAAPGAPTGSNSSAAPNPSAGGDAAANGAAQPGGGGDQDYTAQWAAYYRAYGMEKEAQQIEEMARNKSQVGHSWYILFVILVRDSFPGWSNESRVRESTQHTLWQLWKSICRVSQLFWLQSQF